VVAISRHLAAATAAPISSPGEPWTPRGHPDRGRARPAPRADRYTRSILATTLSGRSRIERGVKARTRTPCSAIRPSDSTVPSQSALHRLEHDRARLAEVVRVPGRVRHGPGRGGDADHAASHRARVRTGSAADDDEADLPRRLGGAGEDRDRPVPVSAAQPVPGARPVSGHHRPVTDLQDGGEQLLRTGERPASGQDDVRQHQRPLPAQSPAQLRPGRADVPQLRPRDQTLLQDEQALQRRIVHPGSVAEPRAERAGSIGGCGELRRAALPAAPSAHPWSQRAGRHRSHLAVITAAATAGAGSGRCRHVSASTSSAIVATSTAAAALVATIGGAPGGTQPQRGAEPVEPRTTSSGRNTYSARGAGCPVISSTSARTAASPMSCTDWRSVVSGGSVNAISTESS
jgi:hypothetical protein